MKQAIFIVGCGFPQLSLIRRARALGLFVYGADMNPFAVGVTHCNEFVEVSTADVDAIAPAVTRLGVRAVTTTGSEIALKATAAVCELLDLPFYADPETVRRCQEKGTMRATYMKNGVAVPAFATCEVFEEAARFADANGFPLVVKPMRGWGQRGVAKIESRDELRSAFEEARAHSQAAGLAAVVVESWLEGGEYSVNGWIERGELINYCVTERITVPGNRPLGVMVAELYPSGLSPKDEARVIDEAKRGAKALGHTRGPCYSQVSANPKGAYLFETAARCGGGFDADVTYLASGVNLYDRLLGVALGDRTLEQAGKTDPAHDAAVAKFLVAKPGDVQTIEGVDKARTMAGVEDAQVFVHVGGKVLPLTDSAKRAAYVLAHGTTREEVLHRADAALGAIAIRT